MKTGILILILLVLSIAGHTLPATGLVYVQSAAFSDQPNAFHTAIGSELTAVRQSAVKVLTVSPHTAQSATGKAGHKHRKLRQRLQRISSCAAEPAAGIPVAFPHAAVPFTDKHEPLLKSADIPPFQPPRILS